MTPRTSSRPGAGPAAAPARTARRRGWAAALLVPLAACGTIGSAPAPRLYALAGAPAAVAVDCAAAFSIREVRLAGHLDRAEIVIGRDGPEIRAAADALWAAPLRAELPRRITSLIAGRLAGSRVVPYPWRFNEWPGLALTFDIDRMEPQGDGLRLVATWSAAVPGTAARPLGGGRLDTVVPMAGDGAAATVQAADAALGRLADAVAAQAAAGGPLAPTCGAIPGGAARAG